MRSRIVVSLRARLSKIRTVGGIRQEVLQQAEQIFQAAVFLIREQPQNILSNYIIPIIGSAVNILQYCRRFYPQYKEISWRAFTYPRNVLRTYRKNRNRRASENNRKRT